MRKRTAQFIEEQKAAVSTEPNRKVGRGQHPNSRKNLRPKPWPKGVSGNPGGKPGTDVAALICRRAIEANFKEIYSGISEKLMAGDAYAMQVFAERAYGKMKQEIGLSGSVELVERLKAGRKRASGDSSKRD